MYMLGVLFITILGSGLAQNSIIKNCDNNEVNSKYNSDMGQCQNVCVYNVFFLLSEDSMTVSACQRGCRIFNIIYLREDRNINNSKDECYLSCDDAYIRQDLNSACREGCENMQRKKQSELEPVIVYIEQDTKNLDGSQPELDEIEMNMDGQRDYKIPESMYRTLPIESLIEELAKPANTRPSHDWLDCASRNSGIPKWILVTAIISAILMALYLSISSEKKVIGDDLLLDDEEDEEGGEDEAGPLPSKVPLSDEHAIDVDMTKSEETIQTLQNAVQDVMFTTPPPKYTLENEMV